VLEEAAAWWDSCRPLQGGNIRDAVRGTCDPGDKRNEVRTVPKLLTPTLNVRLAATEVVSIRLKADCRLQLSGGEGSVHLVLSHDAKLVL
jgi:hypothetical protein